MFTRQRVIIIYGSTTGNTETLSKYVEKGLKASGADAVVKNVTKANPEELKDYDVIILGSSTWGDGELQDDFIPFEEKMSKIRLDGKRGAVFGCGDSMYPQFCKAVDILEERLKSCGVEIIVDSLKIDGDIEPKLNKAEDWGKNLGKRLNE